MSLITTYCTIRKNKVFLNGIETFSAPANVPFNEFIKSAYKDAGMAYLKFFKMDNLSKLAIIAAEHLLKTSVLLLSADSKEIGILIANAHSCLDTDIQHQVTISDKNNYFPSPAIFVYTLPNILIGEICIRHKIYGENSFMVMPEFHAGILWDNAQLLFSTGHISAVIGGWVEYTGENFEAFLYLHQNDNLSTESQILFENKVYICDSPHHLKELYNRHF
jgi:hypothetical protein